MWYEEASAVYFNLIEKYRDRIIIEIAGHDHLASLRSHTGSSVLNLEDPATEFSFHNMIIAPAFTPWYKNNPAVSAF